MARRKRSKKQNWRSSRDWRVCRIITIRRDKVCQLCGTRKRREVHHINSARYFPLLRTNPDNCIVLCKVCHRDLFHILYKGGYRKKTTEKDLYKFMSMGRVLINKGKDIENGN